VIKSEIVIRRKATHVIMQLTSVSCLCTKIIIFKEETACSTKNESNNYFIFPYKTNTKRGDLNGCS